MARTIVAIVIIILILSLGIAEQFFINKTFNDLHDQALAIENDILDKNYEKALLQAQALLEWWRDRRDLLELTSPHNEVKDHVNFLAQLEGYLVAEQYQDALCTTYAIREDALNKLNILSYRIKNVF